MARPQTAPRGPSLRSQWLLQWLKRLRSKTGMGLEVVARHMESSTGSMSRLENALTKISKGDLKELLDLYDVSDEQARRQMEQLRSDAWRRDWWDGMTGAGQEPSFVDYAWLESRATTIRCFEALMIPGLLQTPEYAEAIIRANEDDATPDDQIADWIRLRMRRQQILDQHRAPCALRRKLHLLRTQGALR